MTTYTLLDIPGTELVDNQCEGFGCVDTCADCAPRCPFCGASLHARMCDPQRVAMGDDDASDVQSTLDRLTAIVDKHGTVENLREQLATAHEALGAARAVLHRIDLTGNQESIAVGIVLLAIDKALA